MTTVPEQAVEAAAEAMYVSFTKSLEGSSKPWTALTEWAREQWRTDALAALTAADQPWRDALAREIEAADPGDGIGDFWDGYYFVLRDVLKVTR